MNSVPLHRIWRDIGGEIGFYTRDSFEAVPATPGVYAWYWPLQLELSSSNIREVTEQSLKDDFSKHVKQSNSVMDYDASIKGSPQVKLKGDLIWRKIKSTIKLKSRVLDLKEKNMGDIVQHIQQGDNLEHIRKIFMKATIFMPPLYIGKTEDLYRRCREHRGISGNSSFYSRFTDYIERLNLPGGPATVDDLLFVCIKTRKEDSKDRSEYPANLDKMIEKVLQLICKPGYSAR